MNFTNRDSSTQQSQPARNTPATPAPHVAGPLNNALKHGGKKNYNWVRGTLGLMLLSVTIIIVGLVYLLHITNPSESRYINSSKLQAVFLQSGQVYFGHIKTVSDKYIDLRGIFYLNNNTSTANGATSSTSNSNNLSLVKLGCELHGPYDEMVINQSQISFWENLRSDGQVAKAVAQFNQQNPKGQTCTQNNQTTNQATGTTQSAGSAAPSAKQ